MSEPTITRADVAAMRERAASVEFLPGPYGLTPLEFSARCRTDVPALCDALDAAARLALALLWEREAATWFEHGVTTYDGGSLVFVKDPDDVEDWADASTAVNRALEGVDVAALLAAWEGDGDGDA